MCDDNNIKNNDCCLESIVSTIIDLQCQDDCCSINEGCDKPFLGPSLSVLSYNTRPISLYNCTTGALWSFPYTIDGTTLESSVFRAEDIDDCCLTCRILIDNTDGTYTSTNEFFTINLKCCSAIQCHNDTYVDII